MGRVSTEGNARRGLLAGAALAALIVIAGFIFYSGHRSRSNQTQTMEEMKRTYMEIRMWVSDHADVRPEEIARMSLFDFVTAGAVSPKEAMRLEKDGVQFHGYDPQDLSKPMLVLERKEGPNGAVTRTVIHGDGTGKVETGQ